MNNKSFIFYVIFFISVFVFLTTTTPINASQAEKKFKPAKAQLSSSSYYMIKKISSEFDGKVRS